MKNSIEDAKFDVRNADMYEYNGRLFVIFMLFMSIGK